ncbi:MAG: alpha/beta hydrolase [Myxococcota bacterium]
MRTLFLLIVATACRPRAAPSTDPSPSSSSPSETPTDTDTPGSTSPTATDTASETTPTTGTTDPLAPDYRPAGPYVVDRADARFTPSAGCTTDTRTFRPQGVATDTLLVLAHGFSRNQDAVADLAEHLASWGLPVATMDLCHSTPLDNDPLQDGADLVALADELGAGDRLYAGHSAGGLRSVLAATLDPAVISVLGLDLVDLDELALDAAPSLSVPVGGVLGDPYSCNDSGNGLPVYGAAPDAQAIWVHEADHCDFEWPTGALCTAFCSQPSTTPEARIQDTIHVLATAWALWRTGLDPAGARWWTVGEPPLDALVSSGAVTVQ